MPRFESIPLAKPDPKRSARHKEAYKKKKEALKDEAKKVKDAEKQKRADVREQKAAKKAEKKRKKEEEEKGQHVVGLEGAPNDCGQVESTESMMLTGDAFSAAQEAFEDEEARGPNAQQVCLTCHSFLWHGGLCTHPTPPRPQGMLIFVKTLGKKVIPLRVKSTDSIADVKEQIKDKESIPIDRQCLVVRDYELRNGFTLASCNIQEDSTLYLTVLAPPQVCPPPHEQHTQRAPHSFCTP